MWLACFGENGVGIWCHFSFLSMLLIFGRKNSDTAELFWVDHFMRSCACFGKME